MVNILKLILLLLLLLPLTNPSLKAADDRRIVKAGTLIDGSGQAAQQNMMIVVEDGLISDVFPEGSKELPEGKVMDASKHTVIPGLIDTHVHFTFRPFPTDPMYTADMSEVEDSLRSLMLCGVTTAVSMSDIPQWMLDLTAKQKAGGKDFTPRILKVGPALVGPREKYPKTPANIAAMKGDGYSDEFVEDYFEFQVEVPSVEAVPAVIEDVVKRWQPDLIKIRFLKSHPEICQAVVDEAHKRGLKVVVHVENKRQVRDALASSADAITHVKGVSGRSDFDVMIEKNIAFMPTLGDIDIIKPQDWFKRFSQPHFRNKISPRILNWLRKPEARPSVNENLRQYFFWNKLAQPTLKNLPYFYENGQLLAASDAGVTACFFGLSLLKEIVLFARNGLTISQAIRTATYNPAQFLNLHHELGLVKTGYQADLVILTGDLSQDLSALYKTRSVCRGGKWWGIKKQMFSHQQ